MPKPTLATIVLAGVTVLSSTAMAGSSTIGPTYIGDRSANPEQETYGYVVTTRASTAARLCRSSPQCRSRYRRRREGHDRVPAAARRSKETAFDHSGSSGSRIPHGPLAPSIDF